MTQRTGATGARLELAAEARRLREHGLTLWQIGKRLDCSHNYVSDLLRDPDGSRARARKDSYRGTCQDCGGPTDGSNGRGKAPKRCAACSNARRRAPHGTRSRYHSGCSCDACRAAHRAHVASLKGKPPPTHGYSGYTNYGCRCDICRQAHTEYLWLGGYRERWVRKVRGTDPPQHGTRTAYQAYGCRCDACKAAEATYQRRRRRAKQETA